MFIALGGQPIVFSISISNHSRFGSKDIFGFQLVQRRIKCPFGELDAIFGHLSDYLCDLIAIHPVSYTHLDVYKRQPFLTFLVWFVYDL